MWTNRINWIPLSTLYFSASSTLELPLFFIAALEKITAFVIQPWQRYRMGCVWQTFKAYNAANRRLLSFWSSYVAVVTCPKLALASKNKIMLHASNAPVHYLACKLLYYIREGHHWTAGKISERKQWLLPEYVLQSSSAFLNTGPEQHTTHNTQCVYTYLE